MKYRALRDSDDIAIDLLTAIFATKAKRRKKADDDLSKKVKLDYEKGLKLQDIQKKYKIGTYALYKILDNN